MRVRLVVGGNFLAEGVQEGIPRFAHRAKSAIHVAFFGFHAVVHFEVVDVDFEASAAYGR